jgi:very-short-patch-repair endonuclease
VRFGAYATAAALAESKENPASAQALAAGAVMASADRTYSVSHESAAVLHNLEMLAPVPKGTVMLTREPAAASGRSRRANGVIIHDAGLPDAHVTAVGGVRVTTPARTVVDLARVLPFRDAVVVVDSAIRKRKASKAQMRQVLQACCQWPGAAAAGRVIDFSSGLSESPLESSARVLFRDSGLPAPRLQVQFISDDCRSATVDFYWAEYKTVAEADGMLKYNDPDNPRAMRAQFQRDQLLRDLGKKVVHFTWHEVFYEPERIIARICKAFAAPSPW